MIRGVVFDFDGTLVESNRIKRQTFLELAREFAQGLSLMEDILARGADKDRYWVFDQFVTALSVPANAESLADRYTRICQEKIADAPEIAGAELSLEQLGNEGKLLFVNSATPIEPLLALIRLRRMEKRFSGVYGAPRTKHENLVSICTQYNLRPDETLVVGDGESDRAAAEIFGCHFIAVANSDNNFLQQPSLLIADLTGLPAMISSTRFIN